VGDGAYCDFQTEVRFSTLGPATNVAVRWHAEVPYYATLDVPVATPSIRVEPLE
jgi:hypothetical protein